VLDGVGGAAVTDSTRRWLQTLRAGDVIRWSSADVEAHPGVFTGWVDARVDMWGSRGVHLVTVVDPSDPVPCRDECLELAPDAALSGRFADFELYDMSVHAPVAAPALSAGGVVTVPAWTPDAVSAALTRWARDRAGVCVAFTYDPSPPPRPRVDTSILGVPAAVADQMADTVTTR
jgi:hypothetical protein